MIRQKINKDLVFLFNLFKGKTENTLFQFIRYTFVGGIAFIVDFGSLIILTEFFKIYYLVSAGIAFLLGLSINYFLSVRWVFYSRTLGNRFMEFVLFTLVGIIGLGLNELFIWILTDVFGVFYVFSKIITTIIVYFWNFFARKLLLFNKERKHG
jgi:putative flippase GtrA